MEEDDSKINWLEMKTRLLLRDGLDVDGRTLSIDGSINHKNFIKFDRQLRMLEDLSEEPVDVYINSGGGDCYAMFAYIDRIQGSSVHITTIATGFVASAAIPILVAGHTRQSTVSTSFMHHACSYEVGYERITNHTNELQHIKNLEVRIAKFLAKETKKPYSYWTSTGKHLDYYFEADEAIELGVIDELI